MFIESTIWWRALDLRRSDLIWQTEPKIQCLVFIVWGLLMTTPARADCEDIPPVGNRAAIHFHPESILPVESEASFKVTWLPMTNHRPVLPSRDLYWPMTGQYSGHVTVINQWQASIQVTWSGSTNKGLQRLRSLVHGPVPVEREVKEKFSDY